MFFLNLCKCFKENDCIASIIMLIDADLWILRKNNLLKYFTFYYLKNSYFPIYTAL